MYDSNLCYWGIHQVLKKLTNYKNLSLSVLQSIDYHWLMPLVEEKILSRVQNLDYVMDDNNSVLSETKERIKNKRYTMEDITPVISTLKISCVNFINFVPNTWVSKQFSYLKIMIF